MTPAPLPDVSDRSIARHNEGERGVVGSVCLLAVRDAASEVGYIVGEGGQVEDGREVGEGGTEEQELLPQTKRSYVVFDHLSGVEWRRWVNLSFQIL